LKVLKELTREGNSFWWPTDNVVMAHSEVEASSKDVKTGKQALVIKEVGLN